MTAEQNIFENLPEGKITGFCQPPNSSVWKDGGDVVEIDSHCIRCSVAECMMFSTKKNSLGQPVKVYTQHDPEW